MRLSADATRLEADICVIGAGPAGLTLARELIGLNATVLVLESGGLRAESQIQRLNEGAVIGDPYAGLHRTRHRQVGGTAHTWNTRVLGRPGAKYVPLDSVDFEERSHVPYSGWPFGREHLEPFYRRAQVVCGLGPFIYDGADWATATGPRVLGFGDQLTTRVYQFGSAQPFAQTYVREVNQASRVRLCHHATVTRLITSGAGRRVVEAEGTSLSGGRFRVRASIFVLAAGAIENARLLLLSGEAGSPGPGNQHDWVGRCFMEHPRDSALTLIPRSPDLFREAAFYDMHEAGDGTMIGGRLAVPEEAVRAGQMPNVSITLLPRQRRRGLVGSISSHLRALLVEGRWRRAVAGYGWSDVPTGHQEFDGFHMLLNIEQRPNPENRVVLAQTRDALGIPGAEVRWRWRDEEQAELERLRKMLREWVEASGLGRVEGGEAGTRPDPNAHHHAGTTRIHVDPRLGVADADARVHGTENLYLTGASVFPTAGFANPTLTIVAIALRLADRLKEGV
jgi:choline dehydrogenase-like flavoprotein